MFKKILPIVLFATLIYLGTRVCFPTTWSEEGGGTAQSYSTFNYFVNFTSATHLPTGANTITGGGTGTGLDADMLDGQHGSYYLPVSSGGNIDNNFLSNSSATSNYTNLLTFYSSMTKVDSNFISKNIFFSSMTSIETNYSQTLSSFNTVDVNFKNTLGISSGTAIDTALTRLNSVGITTGTFLNISSGTKIDNLLSQTSSMFTLDHNETVLVSKTFNSSCTFLATTQMTSANLTNGATIQNRLVVRQISSGDLGTSADVYTKFASSDSWAKATGSAAAASSGYTTYYMTLGGQQQDLYVSQTVPYDSDIIPDSATVNGIMAFSMFSSTQSIWFGLKTSTGSELTPTYTSVTTIELSSNSCSTGWKTIVNDINNSSTFLALFVNSWGSPVGTGVIPVGAGCKVRYWRKQ